MRSVTCLCEHQFDVDLPEIIDLDADPGKREELSDGSFFLVTCPSCGSTMKPEVTIRILWPSRGINISVEPEYDRADFYIREAIPSDPSEVVIGYPELADRIAVIDAGLDPITIEALKYYLLIKADEAAPEAEVSAWFAGIAGDFIEFHLHGLRTDEIAISRIPMKLYENTRGEFLASPQSEPFISLRWGSYLSVQNLFRRIR